ERPKAILRISEHRGLGLAPRGDRKGPVPLHLPLGPREEHAARPARKRARGFRGRRAEPEVGPREAGTPNEIQSTLPAARKALNLAQFRDDLPIDLRTRGGP